MGGPAGHLSARTTVARLVAANDRRGLPGFTVVFARATCQACVAQAQCSRCAYQSRHLQVRSQAQHEAIQQVRATQDSPAFRERYKIRLGIEGTLSQAVRTYGLRRSHYISQDKVHLQVVGTAAAINLEHYADYVRGYQPVKRRNSAFAALAPT